MTGADPLLDRTTYENPLLEADVVMKGGITSGIVYPRAVARLAQQYRFKNVGGTSAGAIAAAAAAAAEHGRHTERGGFAGLAAVPDQLGEGDRGDSRLLRLFQPDPGTRRLFRLGLAVLARGPRGAMKALTLFPRFPLVALFLIALAVTLAALGELDVGFAVAVCVVAVVLAVIGTTVQVIRDALSAIPENDYGLCRLHDESAREDRQPLTDWLDAQLQALSGKPDDAPLTFGDLWGTPDDADSDPGWDVAARAVNLEMITTDLTHGRPLRLPVPFEPRTQQPVEAQGLVFNPDELRRFFPASVVGHMEAWTAPEGDKRAAHLDKVDPSGRMHPFPLGADLPVVVAARMSLSFPVLISAVPLWEVELGPDSAPRLRRVVFSDGGISSNFPVHFFDAVLPRRPTFGISLTSFPPGEHADRKDESRNVEPPPLVGERAPEHYREIQGMSGFVTAIKDAAQNWRDNAQARIPGFRERIVQVRLDRREGGLNLTMDQKKLAKLARRGEHAGDSLVERFVEPGEGLRSNWNRYRFARYRTGMALIERVLRSADRGIASPEEDDKITITYTGLIENGNDKLLAYRFGSAARLAFADTTTKAYRALVKRWGKKTLDDEDVPKPQPDLRIVPPA